MVRKKRRKERSRAREMRRKILVAVLEEIGEAAERAVDLFDVYFQAEYGASVSRFEYLMRQKRRAREKNELLQEKRRKFTRFMYELKRAGLVAKIEKEGRHYLARTKKGSERLEEARFGRADYEEIPSLTYTVVAFDVPQVEKRKRDWIREALGNMGFVPLQKSVWIGKVKVPEDFIEDVFRRDMGGYVHIFEAINDGTLELKMKEGMVNERANG